MRNLCERGREEALSLMEQQQFAQAVDLLRNLLSLFPHDQILQRELAVAQSRLREAATVPASSAPEDSASQPPAEPAPEDSERPEFARAESAVAEAERRQGAPGPMRWKARRRRIGR